jgi:hypothetical protein
MHSSADVTKQLHRQIRHTHWHSHPNSDPGVLFFGSRRDERGEQIVRPDGSKFYFCCHPGKTSLRGSMDETEYYTG